MNETPYSLDCRVTSIDSRIDTCAQAITNIVIRACDIGPDCGDPTCLKLNQQLKDMASPAYREVMRKHRWIVNPPTLVQRVKSVWYAWRGIEYIY